MKYNKTNIVTDHLLMHPFAKKETIISNKTNYLKKRYDETVNEVESSISKIKELNDLINDNSQEILSLLTLKESNSDNVITIPLNKERVIDYQNIDMSGGTITLSPVSSSQLGVSAIKSMQDFNFIILDPRNSYDKNIDTYTTITTDQDIISGQLKIELDNYSFINYIEMLLSNDDNISINSIMSSPDGLTWGTIDNFKHSSENGKIKISIEPIKAKFLLINLEAYSKEIKLYELSVFDTTYNISGYIVYKVPLDRKIFSAGIYSMNYDSIAPISKDDVSIYFSNNMSKWVDGKEGIPINIPWDNSSLQIEDSLFVKIRLTNDISKLNLSNKYIDTVIEKKDLSPLMNIKSQPIDNIVKVRNSNPITRGKSEIVLGYTSQDKYIYSFKWFLPISKNDRVFIGNYSAKKLSSIDEFSTVNMPAFYYDEENSKLICAIPRSNNWESDLVLDEWLKTYGAESVSSHSGEEVLQVEDIDPLKEVFNNKPIKILYGLDVFEYNSSNIYTLSNSPINSNIEAWAIKYDENNNPIKELIVETLKKDNSSIRLSREPINDEYFICGIETSSRVPFIDGAAEFIQTAEGDYQWSYDESTNTVYLSNSYSSDVSIQYHSIDIFKLSDQDFTLVGQTVNLHQNWNGFSIKIKYNFAFELEKESDNLFVKLSAEDLMRLSTTRVVEDDKILLLYKSSILTQIELSEFLSKLTPEIASIKIGATSEII